MDRSRAATRDVYDAIAAHFAETRQYPWPEVEAFLADAGERPSDGSDARADTDARADSDARADTDARAETVGLDLGCGNGRHLEVLADCVDHAVGLDVSTELLAIAWDRLADAGKRDRTALVAGDAATLPLADDCVDVVVYVATLHHLPTPALRRQSLDELARVLASDGVGLVSAWSTEHDRFDRTESFDATLDWELPSGETVDRYYRVYEPADFEAALEESALAIRDWEVSSGNCYARVVAGDREGTSDGD